MTEKGRVTEISGRLLKVQLVTQEACAACMNAACKTARREVQAYNRDDIQVTVDDCVEIRLEPRQEIESAVLVLGIPLVICAIGYVLGRLIFPGPEGPSALCALGALLLGMGLGILMERRRKLASLPRLVARLDPADIGSVSPPLA